MIIGLVGFIGSGKGTVGDILVNEYAFKQVAFADPLKDAVASIFQWSRHMLEGDTPESREWREKVDPWWTQRLGYEVSPRLILQRMGTEATRNAIADNIWITALDRRLEKGNDYVITDVRFPNEMEFIRSVGGSLVWVKRGEVPVWYDDAASTNTVGINLMEGYDIHESEWSWIGKRLDATITNDGTIDDLKIKVNTLLTTFNKSDMIHQDRKSTRLNSSHSQQSRMPSSA